jgi:ABC-type phosphate transport system permease subunit
MKPLRAHTRKIRRQVDRGTKTFFGIAVIVCLMYVPAIIIGLFGFLGAIILWDSAKHQPEDISMYSMRGHRKLSKKGAYLGAIMCLLLGIFFLIGGLWN